MQFNTAYSSWENRGAAASLGEIQRERQRLTDSNEAINCRTEPRFRVIENTARPSPVRRGTATSAPASSSYHRVCPPPHPHHVRQQPAAKRREAQQLPS